MKCSNLLGSCPSPHLPSSAPTKVQDQANYYFPQIIVHTYNILSKIVDVKKSMSLSDKSSKTALDLSNHSLENKKMLYSATP